MGCGCSGFVPRRVPWAREDRITALHFLGSLW